MSLKNSLLSAVESIRDTVSAALFKGRHSTIAADEPIAEPVDDDKTVEVDDFDIPLRPSWADYAEDEEVADYYELAELPEDEDIGDVIQDVLTLEDIGGGNVRGHFPSYDDAEGYIMERGLEGYASVVKNGPGHYQLWFFNE